MLHDRDCLLNSRLILVTMLTWKLNITGYMWVDSTDILSQGACHAESVSKPWYYLITSLPWCTAIWHVWPHPLEQHFIVVPHSSSPRHSSTQAPTVPKGRRGQKPKDEILIHYQTVVQLKLIAYTETKSHLLDSHPNAASNYLGSHNMTT